MIRTPGFLLLIICEGVLACGYALSLPFLSVYLTAKKGVPPGIAGLFMAAGMLTMALAQGAGGEWSDIIGRKKIMFMSLLGRAALISMMALIVFMDWHYAWLMIFHILGSFTGSLYNPAAKGWIADHVPHQKRIEAYGLLRIGTNVGWAIGPAIGGFLALKSYPLMFSLTAFSYFLASAVIFRGVGHSPQIKRESDKMSFSDLVSALSDRRFALFSLYNVMIAAVMSQLVVGLSIHSVKYLRLPESSIGLFFSLNGAVVVLCQYRAGQIMEKMRITSGIAIGCLLYCAGYFTVGFAHGFYMVALGMIIVSLGEIAVAPGMHALAANMASQGCKGRYLGVQGVAQAIGAAIGILIGTNGIQFISPYWTPGPWVIIGMLAAGAGMGFYSLRKGLTDRENGIQSRKELMEGLEVRS